MNRRAFLCMLGLAPVAGSAGAVIGIDGGALGDTIAVAACPNRWAIVLDELHLLKADLRAHQALVAALGRGTVSAIRASV